MEGNFYVCSTDKTHDIICVLAYNNGFAHGFFSNYQEAIKNAIKTAKDSGSYYVKDGDLSYVILQDIENDEDYLISRFTIAKALELAGEKITVDAIIEDTDEQMYVLNQLLWTDSIISKRDSKMRNRARICRNSENNIRIN